MRITIFLLILANVLFFVWTQDYLGLSKNPNTFRLQQQLLPDQIHIVSNDAPPVEVYNPASAPPAPQPVVPPVSEKPVTEVCIQLRDLSSADAEQLERLLAERLPVFKTSHTATLGTSSYWVHIPPARSKSEAEDTVAELRRLGIREFFIVQENGPNDLAVSLGLFSSRESAASALGALRGRGVRLAQITERVSKPAMSQLEIRGPDSRVEEMNQILAQMIQGVKQVPCRQQNTPTASQ